MKSTPIVSFQALQGISSNISPILHHRLDLPYNEVGMQPFQENPVMEPATVALPCQSVETTYN